MRRSIWLTGCLAVADTAKEADGSISGYGFKALACDYICEHVSTQAQIEKCMGECPCRFEVYAYRDLPSPQSQVCWYFDEIPVIGGKKLRFSGWRDIYTGGPFVVPDPDTPGLRDPTTQPPLTHFKVYDVTGDPQQAAPPAEWQDEWVDKRWVGVLCGSGSFTNKYAWRSPA